MSILLILLLLTPVALVAGYFIRAALKALTFASQLKHIPGVTFYNLLSFVKSSDNPLLTPRYQQTHYEEFVKNSKTGNTVWRITTPIRNFILTCDPQVVKEVFVTKTKIFQKSPAISDRSIFKKPSIFTAIGGEDWKRHRTLMNVAFSDGNLKSLFETSFHDLTNKLVRKWQAASKRGELVDVNKDIASVSLDIIGNAGFGRDIHALDDEQAQIPVYVNTILGTNLIRTLVPKFVQNYFPHPVFFRMKKAAAAWREFLQNAILYAKEEANVHSNDNLLKILMNAKNQEVRPLDNEEVLADAHTFMVAGHETTQATLSWALYYLAKHPQYQDRILEEVKQLNINLKNQEEVLTFEQYEAGLALTKNIVLETLRLNPPAFVNGREAFEDTTLGPQKTPITKGTQIVVMYCLMFRDESLFGKDVDSFRPDRFEELQRNEELWSSLRYVFTPFSIGPRQCIGKKFAELEAALVLARVIENFKLELVPGSFPEEKIEFTLKPTNYKLKLVPRV